ncbi:MAG: pyroglutamyl-peptidase I, partial [Oscillospiraceae bacterium]|nr:pyroglutamyl-peptidase I [Oscillospiraceae bacterium]
MRLLITAFDPFGGERVNAAAEAVSALPDRIGTVELTKLTVPTEFRRCAAVVAAVVDELLPDAVLCVGQAAGRAGLTPERVAINVCDASIPDNAGFRPVDEPIEPDG